MKRTSINPGRVEWCGENPCIFLEQEGQVCVSALVFRVALSPHGRGCGCIILGAPDDGVGWPQAPNLILADNQPLMRWIVDGWVGGMPQFRNRSGFTRMTWLQLDGSVRLPNADRSRHSETLRGSGVEVELSWNSLGVPTPVEADREHSPTGRHEMYSVFVEAQTASVLINGTELPGSVADRQLFGKTMKSAFLALSQTWVSVPVKEG